jgi:hypothetical protein
MIPDLTSRVVHVLPEDPATIKEVGALLYSPLLGVVWMEYALSCLAVPNVSWIQSPPYEVESTIVVIGVAALYTPVVVL